MPQEIKEVHPEPGGSWTVDFADGGTREIRADWIEPVDDWVEFRTTEGGLIALTRADATNCITHISAAS